MSGFHLQPSSLSCPAERADGAGTRKAGTGARLARWIAVDQASRARSSLRRRDMLRLTALVPFAALSAACGSQPTPKPPDRLEALLHTAHDDTALARSIATAHTDLADAAMTVAADREQHASALQREIDRVNPPSPKSTSAAPPPPPPAAPGSSAEARDALTNSLRAAHEQAANLVPIVAPYRAGLVGSIAAGCASLQEVLG
jgi:hypothetical protein